MKRYLPCVVFAVVVYTTSARPQVLLGQDPFGASAPFGGNHGGVPLTAVTGGAIPLPVLDAAATASAGNNGGVFGPSDVGTVGLASLNDPFAGTVGLASLDDPFSGTGISNDLTFAPGPAPVLPPILADAPVAAPAPAHASNPFSVPVFAPVSAQLSDPVLAPSNPDIANEILSGPVNIPFSSGTQLSDPVLAPSSPDIADQILSGPVNIPFPSGAQLSEPVLAPSSPDIADQILSGPVFIPVPTQGSALAPLSDPVLTSHPPIPGLEIRSNTAIAFPAGAPQYYPDSPSSGSDSASAPAAVAPPGITMITKADLVYTAFNVAEINHARDAALAAAVATGTAAPIDSVAPFDPTSVAVDTPAAERATPNYTISIDPVLLSDVAGTSAPAPVSAPVPAPAPAPAGIYSGPTQ